MDFDPLSFGIGFASSSALSLAIWRYRARLAQMQESAESGIEGTRKFIGQAADARYVRDIIRHAQSYHIARDLFDLNEILLEPRLLVPPPPVVAREEDDDEPLMQDVFHGVPVFHDLPQSYAPYNLETIPLTDLGTGDRQVAILGLSGMGKSTTLAVLALMALGELEFESLEDLSQQAVAQEEEGLSDSERTERERERRQMQARAMEKVENARRLKEEQILKKQEELPALEITGLLPVLIHLNDVELEAGVYGGGSGELDPAEPLVRAMQRNVSAVTAQVVGSVIYPALERGGALILIDGYDDLTPDARAKYFHWLQQLVYVYSENMLIITGPVEGFEPLVTLGCTPAFLRAWSPDDYTRLAQKWAQAWSANKHGLAPDDQVMRRLTADNRGRSMLNVSLKLWTGLADDARETGRVGWYEAYVRRLLADEALLAPLSFVAEQILTAGEPVSRDILSAALIEMLPPPEDEKQKDNRAEQASEIISNLTKARIIREVAQHRLICAHYQVTSYLASLRLLALEQEQLVELALDPRWLDALSFIAGKVNMLPVIYRKLSVKPDLMYKDLFELVRWLPDAPADAAWRGDLFKRLAAAMMANEQFLAVRERAMAALIAARDRNVLFVFRQALRSANEELRRLACVGLGALGDPEAVRDLETMMNDPEPEVHLSAALALGAIGTEKSMETMVHALLQGTEQLRRAVAEALAAIPGEGHNILRDGIESDDLMIRRASVFGLARVRAPWALVSLHRAMFEDEQFWVRSAAETAFMAAQAPHSEGPRPHPEADALAWLIAWAAQRGSGVPAGINARQVLIRVLQEGENEDKILAARTLGRLGHVPALKPLYAALRDREPAVRNAVYAALTNIQSRIGESLPGMA